MNAVIDRLRAVQESRDTILNTLFELNAELKTAAENTHGIHTNEVVTFATRLLEIAKACDYTIKKADD